MSQATGTREWAALLASVRAAVGGAAGPPVDLAAVDGDALVEAADAHGLIPHLHALLRTAPAPAALRREVARRARLVAARGLSFTAELHRVLDALTQAGIVAATLKGPALATRLYGTPGARQYTDLDLLVPRTQALRAVETLLAAGYEGAPVPWPGGGRTAGTAPAPSRTELDAAARRTIRCTNEARVLHRGRGTAVEIHRSFTRALLEPLLDPDGCLARAQPLVVGGRPVLDLAPADSLLFLAAHGLSHGWHRLTHVCDFARLVRLAGDAVGAEVAARARRAGAQRLLAVALTLARDLAGVEPPARLQLDAAAWRGTGPLARHLAGHARRHPPADPGRLRWLTLHFLARERLRDRARLVAGVLFRPEPIDFDFVGGTPDRWLLAAALRPVGLVSRHLLHRGQPR